MRNRSSTRPENELMTSPPLPSKGLAQVDGGALYFEGHAASDLAV